MSVICVIAAVNEADMVGAAARSAFDAGCDQVHVFDGGWDGFHDGPSTDATLEAARSAGAVAHPAFADGQAAKRTGMFHRCRAEAGDHVVSLDADETITGRFDGLEAGQHYCVTLQNLVGCDMPGVRKPFPLGDGGLEPFPLLRVFAYNVALRCVTGGVWAEGNRWLRPYEYVPGAVHLAAQFESRFPVLPVTFEHQPRPSARLAAKAAFYREDHPKRRALTVGLAP